MGTCFCSNGDRDISIIRENNFSNFFLYHVEDRKDFGINFYGQFYKFELALNENLPLVEQPYGLLGSSVDLSGRMVTISMKKKEIPISASGKFLSELKQPVYSLVGEFTKSELKRRMKGFSEYRNDLPYASISTSAFAIGESGDDYYLNTLFFMGAGYGILTEIAAVAGRDLEDCCSPEFHYKTYKVDLGKNPLRIIQENDIVSGARLAERELFLNPEKSKPLTVRFHESTKEIEELIDEHYMALKPIGLNEL